MDSSSETHSKTHKNWLIRTHQRQILGPVSKEKLIEFVRKGALADDDEIMSGNGYWFSISEKLLLERYLFGDVPQVFNPISEAKTILAVPSEKEGTHSINPNALPKLKELEAFKSEEEALLPSDDDLDYPDLEGHEYPNSGERIDDDKAPDSTQVVQLETLSPSKRTESSPKKTSALPNKESRSTEDDESYRLPKEEDLEYPE